MPFNKYDPFTTEVLLNRPFCLFIIDVKNREVLFVAPCESIAISRSIKKDFLVLSNLKFLSYIFCDITVVLKQDIIFRVATFPDRSLIAKRLSIYIGQVVRVRNKNICEFYGVFYFCNFPWCFKNSLDVSFYFFDTQATMPCFYENLSLSFSYCRTESMAIDNYTGSRYFINSF